jgi:hypothetical protein
MAGRSKHLAQNILSETSGTYAEPVNSSNISAIPTDVALLGSALFLQRFSLPVGDTFLLLDLVAIGLILIYEFVVGNLIIQYDRLLWFLGLAAAITCSLLVNFKSTMLTGYFQFMVFNALLTLSRPSTFSQYKGTLRVFQFFVMLFSCFAIVQLAAEFVGENDRLTHFYGLFPDFLFGVAQVDRDPPSYFRSNGIFLSEASVLSQIAALGLLVEFLEFGRGRYLSIIALGLLLAYSGTGLMLLLFFLPLAGVRHGRAGLSALFVVLFALALVATGIIDLSHFTSRVGEFEDTQTSGFSRFVAPFWLAAEQFQTGSWGGLLIGSGPGTGKIFSSAGENVRFTGGFVASWIKILYEYGLIGSLIFCCFMASCFRRSRCPGLIVAAIIFGYVLLQGSMTIAIPLCTLHGRVRSRIAPAG